MDSNLGLEKMDTTKTGVLPVATSNETPLTGVLPVAFKIDEA